MADEKTKKPAADKAPKKDAAPKAKAAPKKEAAAPKKEAVAKKEAGPAAEAAAAPEPKKIKKPKVPAPKLASIDDRRAAVARARAKAAPAAAAKTGKTVKVTQIGSPIGRQEYQQATLKGLGLNKLHRARVLEDTPAVRGMIARVQHLLLVETVT